MTKLSFVINDNGEGIEKKKKHSETVLKDFLEDKSGARSEGGSGLGLAIVKHIIEVHERKIYVESEFGVGQNFFLLSKGKISSSSEQFDDACATLCSSFTSSKSSN